MSAVAVELFFRYLQLNALIAVAFLLFVGARRLIAHFDLPVGSATLVRLGRALLIATLVAFVAVQFLPAPARPASAADSDPAAIAALIEQLKSGARLVAERLPSNLDGEASWFLPSWTILLGLTLAATFLACGLAVTAKRTGTQLRSLRRLIRDAVPLRRQGRLRIVVSDEASVPFSTVVLGVAHVVLPVELLHRRSLLRVALRHELQHHRRRDPQWAVGLELMRLALFWNPAARGWVHGMTELHELACDEALVRRGITAREYGHCLLRVAEMAVTRRIVASAAMATTSDRGGQLQRRIEMLFRHDRPTDSPRWPLGLGVVSVLTLVAASYVAAVSWPTAADVAALAPDAGHPGNVAVVKDGDSLVVLSRNEDCEDRPVVDCPDAQDDCCDGYKPAHQTTAPPLEFETLTGGSIDLDDMRGKVVLVDFWAEWCDHCVQSVKKLKLIEEEFAGPDFEIVGISLSRSEELYRKFLADHDVTWPNRHEETLWDSVSAQAFGVKAIPSYYLVDRDGGITHVPLGDPERLVKTIESMIADF